MHIVQLGRSRGIDRFFDIVDHPNVSRLTVFSEQRERDELFLQLVAERFAP